MAGTLKINWGVFLVGLGFLNFRLCACKTSTLATPPVHFALVTFWRWSLANYLLGLASNLNLPDLSFPSSQDYRWATSAQLNRGFFQWCKQGPWKRVNRCFVFQITCHKPYKNGWTTALSNRNIMWATDTILNFVVLL
jgi:hypothetical protein